jgi:hypothetical protein
VVSFYNLFFESDSANMYLSSHNTRIFGVSEKILDHHARYSLGSSAELKKFLGYASLDCSFLDLNLPNPSILNGPILTIKSVYLYNNNSSDYYTPSYPSTRFTLSLHLATPQATPEPCCGVAAVLRSDLFLGIFDLLADLAWTNSLWMLIAQVCKVPNCPPTSPS